MIMMKHVFHLSTEKEQCCQHSETLSCGMVCRSFSLANNPRITQSSLRVLSQHCGAVGSPVTDCMNKQAEAERATNLDSKYKHLVDKLPVPLM
jgi:hypothetical protein